MRLKELKQPWNKLDHGYTYKPILTEKATNESELRNSYTFIVSKSANKVEIKKAVEASYGVSVQKVRTMIYGAETRTRYTKRGIQNSK